MSVPLCEKPAHEVQGDDRRSPANSSGGRPKVNSSPRAIGPLACRKTSPTGFSGVPPIRAKPPPSPKRPRRRRAAALRRRAISAAASADTRRAPEATSSPSTPSCPASRRSSTRRPRRRRRRSSRAPTVSPSRPYRRCNDSAVARVQPALRQSGRGRAPLAPVVLAREEMPLEPVRAARARLVRWTEEVDVQLEVARADRHVDAVPVAAGSGERTRHLRLAGAEEAQNAVLGRLRSCEHAPHGLGLERARPQPLQLARWAWKHDHDRARRLHFEYHGTVPASPTTRRRRESSPACGRRARNRRTGAAAAPPRRRSSSICAASSSSVCNPTPAARASSSIVGRRVSARARPRRRAARA